MLSVIWFYKFTVCVSAWWLSITSAEKSEQQRQTPPNSCLKDEAADSSSSSFSVQAVRSKQHTSVGAKENLVTLISEFEASIVSFHCGVNFLLLVRLFVSYLGAITALAGEGE